MIFQHCNKKLPNTIIYNLRVIFKLNNEPKTINKPIYYKQKNEMIHLIVGNTGSGKTTYSNKLKKNNKGVLFSIDKWNNILFIPDKKSTDGLNWFLERIDRTEKIIMNLIEQLESSNTDTILDLGLSKFEHREKFRKFAKNNGFEIKLHFLDLSKKIRFKRVMSRNQKKGETFEFEVTQENFDFMENWFEKPMEKELENGVIITE